ncbi:MAG: FxsA family protein [Rhodobacteraceae bacterium]|nr:FxsA family protein [Paracoccaceae bacterium]
MRIFLLLLAVPIVEIALFVQLGGAIGLFATLLIVVLTAVIGAWLLRSQGLRIFVELRRAVHQGGDPSEPILHGLMVFSAGLLLLTPGFFTDAVGLALLTPSVRRGLIRLGAEAVASRFASRQWFQARSGGIVIDGTAHSVDTDLHR